MNTPWMSYFKNGVPAQTLDSRDQEERVCHIQRARGGARGGVGMSMMGSGRTASPPLGEGAKRTAALEKWTLLLGHLDYPRAGPPALLRDI